MVETVELEGCHLEAPELPPPPRQLRLTPKQAFGKKLQALREGPTFLGQQPAQPQFTRRKLAALTGIKKSTIERWERGVGDQSLSIGDAKKWASALSCKLVVKNFGTYSDYTTVHAVFAQGGRFKLELSDRHRPR